jgi:nitrite reductase/ring-hydroxylating ferredoxin subunit
MIELPEHSRYLLSHPARPQAGERLCLVEEIADPGAKGFVFELENKRFYSFLVRRGDQVWGYVNSCPHIAAPLTLRDDRDFLNKSGELLFCNVHYALFTFEGKGVGGPCIGQDLTAWPIAVRGDAVFTA